MWKYRITSQIYINALIKIIWRLKNFKIFLSWKIMFWSLRWFALSSSLNGVNISRWSLICLWDSRLYSCVVYLEMNIPHVLASVHLMCRLVLTRIILAKIKLLPEKLTLSNWGFKIQNFATNCISYDHT